jgi:hypothetical protein
MDDHELEAYLQSAVALGLMEQAGTGKTARYRCTPIAAAIYERRATPAEVTAHIVATYADRYGVIAEQGWDPYDDAALLREYTARGVSHAAERIAAHRDMRRLYDLAKAGQGGALVDILESYMGRNLPEE